ncbi:MAG TPA: SBBP repeat-containing protein, partial [Bacteroidia bacterium]
MKKLIPALKIAFTITVFTSLIPSKGQNANLQYAKKTGGTAYDYASAITVDKFNNVLYTGLFQGTVDFDPGAGTQNITAAGGGDAFISKLDENGNLLWAKQLGGLLGERGFAITTDASANVYVTGYFEGAVDFDPSFLGITLLTTLGEPDIFVCKFDASGNLVWAKQMGGSGYDYSFAITVDNSGNVYTTGKFQGTADFNPSALAVNNLISNAGSEDVFVSCLNSSGNYVWAQKIGGASNDNAYGITLHPGGDLLITGYFQGTTDFDPGAATVNLISAGGRDAFVLKLTSAGAYTWAKQLGGTSNDEANAIISDADGYIYTTGLYQGSGDFDPSASTNNLISNGGSDIFVSKLNSSGAFMWSASMGGTLNDEANSITLSSQKEIHISGYFSGTADFDPAATTVSLASAGGSDIFIAAVTTSGQLDWARQVGGASDDEAASIYLDASDNIYTTGYFQGTADFNPESSVNNLVSSGSFEMFIAKINFVPLPMPIELSKFEAVPEGNAVHVAWTTVMEINNNFFTIEKSGNSIDWEVVSVIKGANNSNVILNYDDVDENPYSGISYYRLKQTDFDGRYSYSSIAPVEIKKQEVAVSLFPNPASETITITTNLAEDAAVEVRICDLKGYTIKQYTGYLNATK